MLSFAQYVHGIIVTEVASEGGVLGPLRLRLAGLLPLTTSMARLKLFSRRQEVAREQSFPSSPHRVPFDVLARDLGSQALRELSEEVEHASENQPALILTEARPCPQRQGLTEMKEGQGAANPSHT